MMHQIETEESIHLNRRQETVVRLYSEGLTTKEIAFQLNVSPKTVEYYRAQVFELCKINSIALLTKFALRNGLTTL